MLKKDFITKIILIGSVHPYKRVIAHYTSLLCREVRRKYDVEMGSYCRQYRNCQYFNEINEVPVPYHWSYKMDDIDLAKEDISKTVYGVINRRTANTSDKISIHLKARSRKCKGRMSRG